MICTQNGTEMAEEQEDLHSSPEAVWCKSVDFLYFIVAFLIYCLDKLCTRYLSIFFKVFKHFMLGFLNYKRR